MGEPPDDLALALALADRSDALTMPRFGAVDLHVDTKPDLTPVTDADRSVEADLRRALSDAGPHDAVVGEEYGGTTEFVGRQWVIEECGPPRSRPQTTRCECLAAPRQ